MSTKRYKANWVVKGWLAHVPETNTWLVSSYILGTDFSFRIKTESKNNKATLFAFETGETAYCYTKSNSSQFAPISLTALQRRILKNSWYSRYADQVKNYIAKQQ